MAKDEEILIPRFLKRKLDQVLRDFDVPLSVFMEVAISRTITDVENGKIKLPKTETDVEKIIKYALT